MQRYTYTPLRDSDRDYTRANNAKTQEQLHKEVDFNAARSTRRNARSPRVARLTQSVAGFADLKSDNYNTRKDSLDTILHPQPQPAHPARLLGQRLDRSASTHQISLHNGLRLNKRGVKVEFEPARERSFAQGSTHWGHKYVFPGAEALLVLAGAHDRPELFTELLFDGRATSDDALKEVCQGLQRGAFISLRCFQQSVHDAAAKALRVQSEGSPETNAGHEIQRAHRVVAAYLVGLREDLVEDGAEDAFRLVMDALRPRRYMQSHDQSAYTATVIGICLAGVMRFFKDELERGTKKQKRLQFALTALGTAVGLAPLAGTAVGGVINLLAEPVSQMAYKTRDMTEAVYRVCAGVQDEMRSRPPAGSNWLEFISQLANTMRHCGFPY